MSMTLSCQNTQGNNNGKPEQQQQGTGKAKGKCPGSYRGCCKTDERPVYLFLRYRKTLEQDMKNSLIKVFSIHSLYTGRFIGLSSKVNSVEGTWPRQYGFGLMKFECMEEATKWVCSTPEVKQRDWIDGVDMFAAPCCNNPPSNGKVCIELMEVSFTNERSFVEDYSPQVEKFLNRNNAIPSVISTCDVKNLRGNWMCSGGHSGYIIVNQFDSINHFSKVYNSDDYKSLKTRRNSCADCKVFVIELEPLLG